MNYIYGAAKAPKKPKRKVAILEKYRLACRETAKKIWGNDSTLTIAAVIRHPEITKACDRDKTKFIDNTIRNWISDLCPNKKHGRPRKKK